MEENERLDHCKRIATDMATAGMGWNYDALERLTRPTLLSLKALQSVGELFAMTAGKYQPNRHARRARKHR